MKLADKIKKCDSNLIELLLAYMIEEDEANIRYLETIKSLQGGLTQAENQILKSLNKDIEFIYKKLEK